MSGIHAAAGPKTRRGCHKPTIPELPRGLGAAAADFCAVMAIPLCASLLRQSAENLPRNLIFWTFLALITVALIASHGGYATRLRAASAAGLAINCFLATSAAMLLLAFLLGHPHILTRRWTVADLVLTPAALGLVRGALGFRAAGPPPGPAGRTLIVCHDNCPAGLLSALNAQGISVKNPEIMFLAGPLRQDAIHRRLRALADKKIQDILFLYHPGLDRLTAAPELLAEFLALPARIWIGFDIAGSFPKFLLSEPDTYRIVRVAGDFVSSLNLTKRLFDMTLAVLLLFACAPLLLLAAMLVKLSGPGPVIFRQSRIGAQGRAFTVLKFRTLVFTPGAPFTQVQPGDARVTKIGRFLRRTSLDELLQLINVIKGEMSLVGPRPHAPETAVEGVRFEDAVRLYRLRHRVKPGMTGLAQIRGQRGATPHVTTLEQRLASDLEYIHSWSLWLDVMILIRTVPAILRPQNAW
ncbi:MAG TPA: sugar transferase [Acidocella sp.]|uniref:sugar transferase n=1 Tax=Acidocella sp. TaxID=50710 RepID=UPI002B8CC461|nr:sugar transferase [Acidocella sp.]HVE21259.1 sugar transferase [Acidocella sp.]